MPLTVPGVFASIVGGVGAFWLFWYLVSLAFVFGGNVASAIARPRRPMDTLQRRVFADARFSLGARVRGQFIEAGAQLFTITVDIFRTLRLLSGPKRLPPLGGGTPVLVCPGYLETSASMLPLARWLQGQGFDARLIEYPSTFAPIASNARYLKGRIERVLEETGAERLAVVGHSMGGVIARCLIHSFPEDHGVQVLVCFASPHQGPSFTVGAPGKSVRDMAAGSEHMRAFPVSKHGEVPIHSIIAAQDQIVNPPWAAVCEEGHNIVLHQPVGHMAPLFMAEARDLARKWLLEAGVERAPR